MRGKVKTNKKKTAKIVKSSKKVTKKRLPLLKKILGRKTKKTVTKKTISKKRVVKKSTKIKPKAIKKIKVVKKKLTGKKITAKGKKVTAKKTKRVSRKKVSFLEDKQLSGYLENLLGEEGMQVVNQISRKERSDVDLAEKMELKANIIRKHLYAMYEAGIVTYRRHRSKTGWYTYYWKIHPERISNAINQDKEKQLKELMEMLEYEKNNHFYQCKSKCTRVVFEEASDMGFRCMKCSNQLEHTENAPFVKDLEKRIDKIRVVQEPTEE
jgi:transcription initiation factor TFIIE subunit alpha